MSDTTNRRQFLERASTGAAAAVLTGTSAFAAKSANEKLVVGLIGCGGRGVRDAGSFKKIPGVEVAWLCDVDEGRRQAASAKLGIAPSRAIADLRRILDDNAPNSPTVYATARVFTDADVRLEWRTAMSCPFLLKGCLW